MKITKADRKTLEIAAEIAEAQWNLMKASKRHSSHVLYSSKLSSPLVATVSAVLAVVTVATIIGPNM
jgi:hypothetical protein